MTVVTVKTCSPPAAPVPENAWVGSVARVDRPRPGGRRASISGAPSSPAREVRTSPAALKVTWRSGRRSATSVEGVETTARGSERDEAARRVRGERDGQDQHVEARGGAGGPGADHRGAALEEVGPFGAVVELKRPGEEEQVTGPSGGTKPTKA
jgi:hypothetical protein